MDTNYSLLNFAIPKASKKKSFFASALLALAYAAHLPVLSAQELYYEEVADLSELCGGVFLSAPWLGALDMNADGLVDIVAYEHSGYPGAYGYLNNGDNSFTCHGYVDGEKWPFPTFAPLSLKRPAFNVSIVGPLVAQSGQVYTNVEPIFRPTGLVLDGTPVAVGKNGAKRGAALYQTYYGGGANLRYCYPGYFSTPDEILPEGATCTDLDVASELILPPDWVQGNHWQHGQFQEAFPVNIKIDHANPANNKNEFMVHYYGKNGNPEPPAGTEFIARSQLFSVITTDPTSPRLRDITDQRGLPRDGVYVHARICDQHEDDPQFDFYDARGGWVYCNRGNGYFSEGGRVFDPDTLPTGSPWENGDGKFTFFNANNDKWLDMAYQDDHDTNGYAVFIGGPKGFEALIDSPILSNRRYSIPFPLPDGTTAWANFHGVGDAPHIYRPVTQFKAVNISGGELGTIVTVRDSVTGEFLGMQQVGFMHRRDRIEGALPSLSFGTEDSVRVNVTALFRNGTSITLYDQPTGRTIVLEAPESNKVASPKRKKGRRRR